MSVFNDKVDIDGSLIVGLDGSGTQTVGGYDAINDQVVAWKVGDDTMTLVSDLGGPDLNIGGEIFCSKITVTAPTTSGVTIVAQGIASQSGDLFQGKTATDTPFAVDALGRAVFRSGPYYSRIYQSGQVGYLGGAVSTTSFVITGIGVNSYVAMSPNAETVRFKADGTCGFGTASPTAKVDVNSDILRLRTAKTPASATAAGNQGDICWDANYVYICTATNTWKRVAIATW